MTDDCLKVRETQRLSLQTLRLDGHMWVSEGVLLFPPSTRSTDHQEHIPSLLKKSHFILQACVTAVLCGSVFLPVKWWSLWAVLRNLSDATFYLICWNVASHADEYTHILSDVLAEGQGSQLTLLFQQQGIGLNIHWPVSTLVLVVKVWRALDRWERETFAHLSMHQS